MVSVLTFALYLHTIPYTHFILRTQVTSDVHELLYGMLKRESCIRHPRFNYEIYIKGMKGHKLQDALFRRRDPKDPKGGYDVIAYAREAELLVNMHKKLIHVHMKYCNTIDSKGNGDAYFEQKTWDVELPDDLGGIGKARASDMTWTELFEARADMTEKRDQIQAEIDLHQIRQNLTEPQPDIAEHIKHKRNDLKTYNILLAGIEVEMHQRPAFALGCLCFVLVGCPVGVWFSKSDYLSAFITCFLPVVIIYYPLMLCAINMAKTGKGFTVAGIWGADALMLIAAAFMYRRLVRN
jgi:lipopolysaccharide export system permease protein